MGKNRYKEIKELSNDKDLAWRTAANRSDD